jgi:hypothetical protein
MKIHSYQEQKFESKENAVSEDTQAIRDAPTPEQLAFADAISRNKVFLGFSLPILTIEDIISDYPTYKRLFGHV